MSRTIVELDTRKLNALIRKIPGNVADAVASTAFAIERQAKINAPVDTSALRGSIYARIGKTKDGYAEAAAAVAAARPGTKMGALPEPENATTAYVGPGVEYAVYVELGTSRMGAQPFLLPAVRAVENSLADKFGGIAD